VIFFKKKTSVGTNDSGKCGGKKLVPVGVVSLCQCAEIIARAKGGAGPQQEQPEALVTV
jgi:hypothetical protein